MLRDQAAANALPPADPLLDWVESAFAATPLYVELEIR